MSNIVFFNIPAHGHTNPTIEVVRTLVQRGHAVRYYSFELFRERIEAAGAAFVSCDAFMPPVPKDFDKRARYDFASLIDMVTQVTLAMEDQVCAALEQLRPDCIVTDSLCIWGKLFAKKLRIPVVCSTTTFAFNEHTAKMMKPGFRELCYTIAGMPRISRNLRKLRARGYDVQNMVELIQNSPETDTLVFTSRMFQPLQETFGESYAFVGPSLAKAPSAAPEKKQRPLIYISLGTVLKNPAFYQQCVEALQNSAYDVVISAGDEANVTRLKDAPAHFHIRASVPQLEVLQRADVFVTHGGMNSVSESIAFQVPMVLFPQQSEQGMVAQRAQALGVGKMLAKTTADGIRAAIEDVLQTKAPMQRQLKIISDSFLAAGGPEKSAAKIENVLRLKEKL